MYPTRLLGKGFEYRHLAKNSRTKSTHLYRFHSGNFVYGSVVIDRILQITVGLQVPFALPFDFLSLIAHQSSLARIEQGSALVGRGEDFPGNQAEFLQN